MGINLDGDEGFPPLTPEEIKERKEIEKLLSNTKKLNPRIKKTEKSQKQKQKQYEMVCNYLSEFLDSYVILGFDTSGEDFVSMKYNNPMERRGLTNLVDEFFSMHFENLSNAQGNNTEEDDDDE